MALIKCPECKKQVSDSAETCPHCGYKLKETSVEKHIISKNKGMFIAVLITLPMVFGVSMYFFIDGIDWGEPLWIILGAIFSLLSAGAFVWLLADYFKDKRAGKDPFKS